MKPAYGLLDADRLQHELMKCDNQVVIWWNRYVTNLDKKALALYMKYRGSDD